ncbi:MAG TPA: tyrosine-type recombinase/integrase, partial [Candidatus Dormibacteraeota bacterium]|nr:tyrosine-type recombinase/integrase [Candidatus Dormibacteraeota bacterium]
MPWPPRPTINSRLWRSVPRGTGSSAPQPRQRPRTSPATSARTRRRPAQPGQRREFQVGGAGGSGGLGEGRRLPCACPRIVGVRSGEAAEAESRRRAERRGRCFRAAVAIWTSTITKVKERGWGASSEAVAPVARTTAATAGPLLITRSGERLDRWAAWKVIRGLARTAGVEHAVFPHALRHGFVTAALDAGVPLHRVQDAAGHRD